MPAPVLSIVMLFQDQEDINVALAATTAIDVHLIRKYGLPKLYESGVRYRREVCLAKHIRETCERFLTAEKLLQERFGDCDDLAPYRAAELILSGVRARARAVPSPAGWHCIVKLPNGTIEDPSAKLGMRTR